jgi:uncharacterized membrane protein YhaH (DUF805 family)
MDWKYLFTSFEGRIGRQPWWLGNIALTVILWIILLIITMVFGGAMMPAMDGSESADASAAVLPSILIGIIYLLSLWPSLALSAKRWHDRGKSGWWSLILIIPLIGFIWFLIECGFLRGTEGPNQYGNDPLA